MDWKLIVLVGISSLCIIVNVCLLIAVKRAIDKLAKSSGGKTKQQMMGIR